MNRRTAPSNSPLSDVELAMLAAFLKSLPHPGALSVEGVDGLFGALIAGPELVFPEEYLPLIWGDTGAPTAFASQAQADAILQLLRRHWNAIIQAFQCAGVYLPLIDPEDVNEHGVAGQAWARGFMRGARLRWELWRPMFEDETEGSLLMIPVIAGEVDPAWPPGPLSPQARDDVLKDLAIGLASAYRRFVRKPPVEFSRRPRGRRSSRRIGRNELCPCGSGRRFEFCCSASADVEVSLH